MKTAINGAIVLFIGLVLGSISAQALINSSFGQSTIRTGAWSASAFVGGLEVDPYTTARIAIEGTVPLGAAEGLAFQATTDDSGADLLRECRYRLAGNTPAARFWTLSAHTPDGNNLRAEDGKRAALLSYHVLRKKDFSFEIIAGNQPSSGNWLRLDGTGPYKMVLRLYDTSITSSARGAGLPLPQITRMDCSS